MRFENYNKNKLLKRQSLHNSREGQLCLPDGLLLQVSQLNLLVVLGGIVT